MSCFMWFAHEVNYPLRLRQIKIKIGFHAAVMCMRRHGVPDAAFFKNRNAHHQLAALNTIVVNVFVDGAVVVVIKAS